MLKRGIVCLAVALIATPLLAMNPDMAVGMPTNATQVSGPGGDLVSAYAGNLEIPISIGPTWKLPGLSWGLSLHYSSMIWSLWPNPNNSELALGNIARRGPFGDGWRLTMGRVYQICLITGCPGIDQFYYEDPSGTSHQFLFDPNSRSGLVVPGKSIDGTYMRAEMVLKQDNDPNSVDDIDYFRIFPGNGLVLTFDSHRPEDPGFTPDDGQTEDFYGWLLTEMERRGPDATTVYSRVEVAYDPNHPFCMSAVRDYLGDSNTPLREITFVNASEKAGVTIPGGYTTEIHMPGIINGNQAGEVVYRFSYEDPTDLTLSVAGTYWSKTYQNQLLLSRIEFPGDPNIAHTFSYDPTTGELTGRTFPTGAGISYTYGPKQFSQMYSGLSSNAAGREVRSKSVTADGQTWTWSFYRYRGTELGGPGWTTVTDPFDNQTRYVFFDLTLDYSDPNVHWWTQGMTQYVETIRGAPYQGGGLVGTPDVIRRVTTRVAGDFSDKYVYYTAIDDLTSGVSQRTIIENFGYIGYGRFQSTAIYGYDSSQQQTASKDFLREYDEPTDPNSIARRYANWVIQPMTAENVRGPSGVLRRSEMTYLDDGTLSTTRKLVDPNAPSAGDVLTELEFDPNTGLPILQRVTGGDDGSVYQSEFTYSGPYLIKKRTLEPSGTPFPYYSFDVDRDARTGLVLASRDASGNLTTIAYDELGRPTLTTPPGEEEPTVTTYDGLRSVKVLRGPSSGSHLEATTYLDDLGRTVETRRVTGDGSEVTKFNCYDAVGRLTFASVWHSPGNGESPGAPTCPPAHNGAKGTAFDYAYQDGSGGGTDPLGRVHMITAPDGARTKISYLGKNTSATAYDINETPGSGIGTETTTTFMRDGLGRLSYVDAPEGADARYTYDAAGDLKRIELLEDVEYGAPFIQVRSFGYDALGRLHYSNNLESGTVLFTKYDAAGNLLQKTDSDGTVFMMTYDAAGRLTKVESSRLDPNQTLLPSVTLATYTYDNPSDSSTWGRVTQADSFDENGVLVAEKKYAYDPNTGRPTDESIQFPMWDGHEGIAAGDPVLRTCYTYDAFGFLSSMRYPSEVNCATASTSVGKLTYSYNYGRLTGISDSRNPDPNNATSYSVLSNVSYNVAGGVKFFLNGNGVTTTVTPDLMYRPQEIKVQGPGGGQGSTYFDTGTFAYDGRGDIINIGTDAFSYDLIGRLKTADLTDPNGSPHQLTWTYDDFGNILSEMTDPNGGGSGKIFSIDPYTNRIESMASAQFEYDQRGNLTGQYVDPNVPNRYFFDARNRLISARTDAGTDPTAEFTYDSGGLRLMKTDPATGRRTFYVREAGGNVLSELVPSDAGLLEGYWRKDYYYALGRVIGQAEEVVPRPVEGLVVSEPVVPIDGQVPSVSLSWQPSSDAGVDAYVVYRKDPAQTDWTPVVTRSAELTSWTDYESFAANETRLYAVAATAGGMEGRTSRALRVEPLAAAPSMPQGLRADLTATSVTLRWNRVPEDEPAGTDPNTTFMGYAVLRSEDPNQSWSGVIALNAVPLRDPVFHDLSVHQGQTYYYMVESLDTLGRKSQAASVLTVTPQDYLPPAVPQGVTATSGPGKGEVTIWWNPNSESDLAGYRIYREVIDPNTQTSSPQQIADVGAEAVGFTDSSLPEGATYTYEVAAYDAQWTSALSASVSARPRVSAPPAPEATNALQQIDLYGNEWVEFDYAGDPNYTGPPNYTNFQIFRKKRSDPAASWTLMTTTTVPATFREVIYDRCSVMDYVVGAETNISGHVERTVDSELFEAPTALVPEVPEVSTQGSNVAFDAQGLIGCGLEGPDYEIGGWKLVREKTDGTVETFDFDTGATEIQTSKPPNGEVWAYALKAVIIDRYETMDPNNPAVDDSYMSQDLCVTSNGDVDPNDEDCPDLDDSQLQPPPPGPSCLDNPWACATGGGGGGGSWQQQVMRMMVCLGTQCRGALELPEPQEAPPGEAGWRVARKHRGEDSAREPVEEIVDLGPAASREMQAGSGAGKEPGLESVAGGADRVDLSSNSGGSATRAVYEPRALQTTRSNSRQHGEGVGRIASSTYGSRVLGNETGGFPPLVAASPDGADNRILAGGIVLPGRPINDSPDKHFVWSFFHTDHLGSVRVITDQDGAVTWLGKFYPYGVEMPGSTGTTETKRYAGHPVDSATGLVYMAARYNNPAIGRFLSVDPHGNPDIPWPHTRWHGYDYAIGDPIDYIDPDGRQAGEIVVPTAALCWESGVCEVIGASIYYAALNSQNLILSTFSRGDTIRPTFPNRSPDGRRNTKESSRQAPRETREPPKGAGPFSRGPWPHLPPGAGDAAGKLFEVLLAAGEIGLSQSYLNEETLDAQSNLLRVLSATVEEVTTKSYMLNPDTGKLKLISIDTKERPLVELGLMSNVGDLIHITSGGETVSASIDGGDVTDPAGPGARQFR